jgi:phage gp46-like protein
MDAWINPETRDYERTTAPVGSLVRDPANGLANAAYLRLMTPLGSWFGDITLGSRLHELQRSKDLPRVERLALQYARTALQPLLNDGRAKSIDISTVREKDATAGGRLLLEIVIVDAVGNRQTLRFPVRVA